MKKYGMILAIVIFTLAIMLIPNNKIMAWEDTDYININYNHDNVIYYINEYSDFLEFMDEKLKEYVEETGYKYIVYFGHNNNITTISNSYIDYNVVFYAPIDTLYMYSYIRYDYSSQYRPFGDVTNSTYLFHTNINYEDFLNGEYDNVENIFEHNKITTWNYYPYFRFGFQPSSPSASYSGEDIFDLINRKVFYFPYDTNANLVLKKDNDYFLNVSFDGGQTISSDGDTFITYKTQFSDLNLKKEFTHTYNGNTLKYIDLYFDKNDYGKTINFELNITDNSDYSLCDATSDFVNGKSCIKPDLISTQMAFLEDKGNGLYKWTGGITLGDTIDYSVKYTDNGFTITGQIQLNHDLNSFNYEKIRVSFGLSSAFNVSYSYSDDSSITSNNIDEYYSWMMLLEEQRLNRIDYNQYKYTILTTDYESFSTDILVEYINTSKYLFVEYFDTSLSSYLENGNIYSTPNYINNRDIEKFSINIGTSNNRGVYLLNHLKNEELSTSKYYFYIPEDLYFSQTESLGDSIYIDNTGSNNTNGVIAKPEDNYEDSSFANDFFNTFQNNDFGLSAVISSPLKFIQNLNSQSCATIDLTLPYIDKSLQLPCMTEIYEQNFGEVFNLYQIITTGFVAYWVSVRIYALVKNFKNPEDDKIEVMDL